jgi:hypothetical protein
MTKPKTETYAEALQRLGIAIEEIKSLNLADDRLVGAREIARHRGEEISRTRYLIAQGQIPVYREGSLIVASKYVLQKAHVAAAASGACSEAA